MAGGGRGSFNHRFAQPSRDGHPYLNKLYPSDIFPFTDIEQNDAETGIRDGLLSRVEPQFLPKVFYTNSSYEYWGRAASLIHTTIDGLEDIPLMENVRIYSFAGGQHGPGRFPPVQTSGQQLSNPNDYSWFMRSLLVAMDNWTREGTPPPASAYARIGAGELVLPADLDFPDLPGVGQPATPHGAYRADYGPEFRTKGIVTIEPPEVLSKFPVMVPQVDSDGNEIGGLKMPEISVPLATYTGWNLFPSRIRTGERVVKHAGVLHPAPSHTGGPHAGRRPEAVDPGTLPEPGALPGPRVRGGDRSDRRRLPSGRRPPRILSRAESTGTTSCREETSAE